MLPTSRQRQDNTTTTTTATSDTTYDQVIKTLITMLRCAHLKEEALPPDASGPPAAAINHERRRSRPCPSALTLDRLAPPDASTGSSLSRAAAMRVLTGSHLSDDVGAPPPEADVSA